MPAITIGLAKAIHDASIRKFGGLPGVRDERLLESALAQPWQSFGRADLYLGDITKACRFAFGVIWNHPFVDGNKRIGVALPGTYLRMRRVASHPDHNAFLSAILSVADGSSDHHDLVAWVDSVIG